MYLVLGRALGQAGTDEGDAKGPWCILALCGLWLQGDIRSGAPSTLPGNAEHIPKGILSGTHITQGRYGFNP